jgi:hypothetical protein
VTGSIAARRPRIALGALGALGAATIVAYGACYYSYGVLIVPIAADTGWSRDECLTATALADSFY